MLGKTILAAATAIAGLTAIPSAASAHDPYYDGYGRGGYEQGYYGRGGYDRGYRGDYRRYRRGDYYGGNAGYRGSYGYRDGYSRRGYRCGSGTTGAIVGGATGALVGREIGRNGRRGYYSRRGGGTTGAIIGGAVGALVGRNIDRSC